MSITIPVVAPISNIKKQLYQQSAMTTPFAVLTVLESVRYDAPAAASTVALTVSTLSDAVFASVFCLSYRT